MLPFPLTRPLTWIDLETTSKRPHSARIVEISIIQFLPDGTTKEWWSVINPGVTIPPGATEKHGYTDDDVVGKPRFEDVAERLLPAFRQCDYGGYNIRYDLDVLKAEYERVRVNISRAADDPPARVLDGLRLWQLVEPRTLTDFVKRWTGEDHTGAHGAKADIEGTIRGVEALLAQVPQDVLPHDLQKLHDLQFPVDSDALDSKNQFVIENGIAVFNFGKHRGKPVKSEKAYFKWWVTQSNRTDEERALEERIFG